MKRPVSVAVAVLVLIVGSCGSDPDTAATVLSETLVAPTEAPTPDPTPAPTTTITTTTEVPPTSAATPPEDDAENEPEPEATLFETFDSDNFTLAPSVIDNEWLPLTPGMRLVYKGTTNEEDELLSHTVILTVTDLVKEIDGVLTLVAWDQDFADGELVETELAFYAQDDDGTVWRMGEYPEEYEDGELVEAPAWLAGLADAKAGMAMLADPQLGSRSYSQGWGPDVDFIDRALIEEVGADVCISLDCYANVLVIAEFNVEEPNSFQLKYFAPGVGNIRVDWRGDDTTQEELDLVEIVQLTAEELAAAHDAAFDLEAQAYETSAVYQATPPARQR